jgi:sugar/nucleoside kinase (ribokinase family)
VRATAEPLGPVHIPPGWFAPAVVHLAPVAGEVNPGVSDLFPQSLRCATLQGWMRGWDSDGKVRHAIRPETELAARNAHASVFSIDDVGGSEKEAGRLAALSPAAAVTDGERGCRVHWKGEVRAFPAPAARLVDPTGAGDIFAAVFFLRLKETGNAWEAGRMAVELASRSVTRPGLAGVPTGAEILEAKRTGESS